MRPLKNRILQLICIILVFSSAAYLQAQINTDSLVTALKTVNKTEKLDILNTLSNYYLVKSPGRSIEYGSQAMSIADELKNIPEKIVALLNIGNAYLSMGYNEQSLNYYKQALEKAKSSSLQKEVAQVSLKIANYYNISSKYEEALKFSLDALKIYKSIDNKPGLSDTYHNIGIVYFYLGNLEKALDFTLKALKIREESKDRTGISKSLNNTAMIYRNLSKNEKALEYYFKALKLMEELNTINDQAITLSNIGITYKQMDDPEKALSFYHKSLALYEQFTDNRNKSRLFVCLGTAYTDLKKFDKAESYLEQGLSLAKKAGYLDMIALNYQYLADLYLMMGDFKKTLDYKNLYFDIKESVFTEENKKRISELQVRIETDNTQREAELIKEKTNILTMFIIFLALALIIIIVVLYSRNKAKLKAQLAVNELNFNNIETNNSIEKLILWNNYQNGTYKFASKDIKLSEEINSNIKIMKSFIDSKKININSTVSDETFVNADPITLNLIMRYLILNAVKNSQEGDTVCINASTYDEFIEVSLMYSSMSIKLDEITKIFATDIQQIVSNNEKEKGENLGLALCKEFIEKSDGKIRVETLEDKKLGFVVTLPKKI